MITSKLKLIILAVLGFSVIAAGSGCKAKQTMENGKIKLRWVSDNNPLRGEQIALFEKANPGIEVALDWSSSGQQKILTQIAGGNAPDLFDVYRSTDLKVFARKGALLPLDDYARKYKVDLNDYTKQLKDFMYVDGKLYALPCNVTPLVLYYNKTLFDRANVPYPNEKWSWDDLINAGGKIRKLGKHTFGFMVHGSLEWIISWQGGGGFFKNDKINIDSPAVRRAYQMVYDFMYKYNIMPSSAEQQSVLSAGGYGGEGPIGFFTGGSVGMVVAGRHSLIAFRKAKMKNFDWTYIPQLNPQKPANLLMGRVTVIGAGSKHPEAAFKFLNFLNSTEYNRLITESADGMPPRMSMWEKDFFRYNPAYPNEKNNMVFIESMKNAKLYDVSDTYDALTFESILARGQDKFYNKLLSLDQFVKTVTEEIESAAKINR